MHDFVEGGGYSTIHAILNGWSATGWLLALLFVCKVFATSTSLGAGSSGGIFSPSLFMVSTLGAAFATFAAPLLPGHYAMDGKNLVIIQGFKEYCALGFFQRALLKDPKRLLVQLGLVHAARVMKFTRAKEIAEICICGILSSNFG